MAIEFETDTRNSEISRLDQSVGNPWMTKFLIDKGIVKDETQAFYVLVGISVTCFLLSIYIFWAYVIGFPVKPSSGQMDNKWKPDQKTFQTPPN